MTKKSTTQKQPRRGKFALILALCTATITATITGCGGNNNPGGGDRFAMYTLTTAIDPENSGVVSRDPHATTYQNATEVTLTANPAAGYRFAGWSDASLDQVTPITIKMTRNVDITANFVPISTPEGYTLKINREPELGGTVSRSPDLTHYPPGTEVTLTANAEPGYALDGWSGELDTTIRIITIIMDEDKELTAHFLSAPHKLTTSATAGGRVTVNPEYDSYTHNARVTATAHVEPGYVFVRWTGASALSSNPVTITMSADRELNAIFQLISTDHHTLTVHTNPADGRGGRVEREPDETAYAFGTDVALRAIPEPGYRFMAWTGGLESENAEDTIRIIGDMTVTAQFQQVRTLTIERDPMEGGTVTPESGLGYDINTPVVNIAATPAEGYRFVNWTLTDGTATFIDANSAATMVTLSSDATIRANFRPFILTVNVLPGSSGRVSQMGITPEFDITAIPASGYVFVNWTVTNGMATFVDVNSADATVTLGSNATITANFHTLVVLNPTINYGTFTDSRDGKSYRTVKIGNQTWMAENLNFNASGSVCYDDNPNYCNIYGRLYDWVTVMDGAPSSSLSPNGVQGICPAGWHVPSDDEWLTLTDFAGGWEIAGRALKSTSGWWNNSGESDQFGFTALPIDADGSYGFWWGATESDANRAWGRSMGSNVSYVNRYGYYKTGLYSLRCVEDD